MPRGRGNLIGGAGRRGGRGAAQGGGRRGGRVSKPRYARSLSFSISAGGNAGDVEPAPGPSVEQSRPNSLTEQIKAYKAAKATDAKNLAKLSPVKKKRLEVLRLQKQVGNFRMPDASEPKIVKGKGKGEKSKDGQEGTRVWGPCPLSRGAPAAPSQMHLPAKNERPQRCKLCYAAKVRRTTVWRCSTCTVNLCIEGCYTDYHK